MRLPQIAAVMPEPASPRAHAVRVREPFAVALDARPEDLDKWLHSEASGDSTLMECAS